MIVRQFSKIHPVEGDEIKTSSTVPFFTAEVLRRLLPHLLYATSDVYCETASRSSAVGDTVSSPLLSHC